MSPEFLRAAEHHAAVAERLGPEHPDTMMAMAHVLEHAPASLKETIRTKAVEMGLMPEADGYLDDGTPVFSLEAVAAKLGAPVAQVEETMRALLALGDGESVALSGELTPKVWTGKEGTARPSLDMVAHAVVTPYHVTRKRQAVAGATAREDAP